MTELCQADINKVDYQGDSCITPTIWDYGLTTKYLFFSISFHSHWGELEFLVQVHSHTVISLPTAGMSAMPFKMFSTRNVINKSPISRLENAVSRVINSASVPFEI